MFALTEYFKLMSEETRLRIVVLLAQESLYVCQICGVLKVPQPKVSKHLSKLRNMKFVTIERKEKYILYSLNVKDDVIAKIISDIIDNIDKYKTFSEDKIRLLDKTTYLYKCKTELPDKR